MKRRSALLAAALLAGCSDLPKDPEGTLERVRAQRVFSVGLIASGEPPRSDHRQLFMRRVAEATGALPAIEEGAAEPLLIKLEEGRLDLVIGPLAPTSPWEKQVSVLPALAEQVGPNEHIRIAPIARNGENAWIALLHREALAVRAGR